MLPHELRLIIPPAQLDILEAYRVSQDFYREVQYRREFDQHCHWYQLTAECHRQELQKMRRDLNIMGWFRRTASN